MKALAAGILLFLAGCASLQSPIPDDYVTRFEEPLTSWSVILITDSYYGGLALVDNSGREIRVYRHMRPDLGSKDEVWLGKPEGRRVNYAGEEGTKLLRILEGIQVGPLFKPTLDEYANYSRTPTPP